MKLPKRLVHLIAAFDDAAQNHGWQQDQGSEYDADGAEKEYLEAKKQLLGYLSRKLRRMTI